MTAEVSPSKLNMLRCIIAMAQADNLIEPQEHVYINEMLAKYGLSSGQKAIVAQDLSHPREMAEMLPLIDDPVYRAHVVDFARMMAFKDGELEVPEQRMLEKLRAHAMKDVDMEKIREAIKANIAKEMVSYDLAAEKLKTGRGGWFLTAFEKILPL